MKKIVVLVPDLSYSFVGRQLSLLAPKLPREEFQLQVVSLEGAGPFARPLQDAGIPVYGHPGRRLFDFDDWLTLRKRINDSRPDLVHVFSLATLRVLRLACIGKYGSLKMLVSPGNELQSKLSWWTRRLLKTGEAVVATNLWERKQLESLEVEASFIRSLPAGVDLDPANQGSIELPFSEGKKFILCVNGFESAASPRDAVWDFDILRYVYPDLQLVMIGDGPALPQVEYFGKQIGREDHRVHYVGNQASLREWMNRAEFIWVPNRKPGGTNVALEAMAAGVPIVASDLPNLRGLRKQEPTMTLVSSRHANLPGSGDAALDVEPRDRQSPR